MEQAREIFTAAKIFVPDTVILETEWVLRYAYDLSPAVIYDGLLKLLGLPNVVLHDASVMAQAFEGFRSGMDFADALHLATCDRCSTLFTFDKKFVRSAADSFQCKVRHP
jgi:predicted nucleic-acid-binding protein